MAKDFDGKAKFVAVDVDNAGDVAEKYKVEYMPTLVVVKDGKEVSRVVGADEKKIRSLVQAAIDGAGDAEEADAESEEEAVSSS